MSDKLSTDKYAPGMWKCRTCGFTQHNSVICPAGVYADNKLDERPCPNDGDVMFPVTWQELAKENEAFGIKLLNERDVLLRLLLQIERGQGAAYKIAREAIDTVYPGINWQG